jgi:hypothetical protein
MCWKNPWYVEIGKGSFKFTAEKTVPYVKTAATVALVPIDLDLLMEPSTVLIGSFWRNS